MQAFFKTNSFAVVFVEAKAQDVHAKSAPAIAIVPSIKGTNLMPRCCRPIWIAGNRVDGTTAGLGIVDVLSNLLFQIFAAAPIDEVRVLIQPAYLVTEIRFVGRQSDAKNQAIGFMLGD